MLGKKIKLLREAKGIVQRDLANALNIDAAYLCKIENSLKSISRHHLKKLSILLEIEEKELITLWLADKVFYLLKDEEQAVSAIRVVEYYAKKIGQTKK